LLNPDHIVKHAREFIRKWNTWHPPRYRCTDKTHKEPRTKTITNYRWDYRTGRSEPYTYTYQTAGWRNPTPKGGWGRRTSCYTCQADGSYDTWHAEHRNEAEEYSRVGLTANAIAMFLGEKPTKVVDALIRSKLSPMYCNQVHAAIWTRDRHRSRDHGEHPETGEILSWAAVCGLARKQAADGAIPVGEGPDGDATAERETKMLSEVLDARPMKRPMTDRNCYYCRRGGKKRG
jgi:hypothetical protein